MTQSPVEGTSAEVWTTATHADRIGFGVLADPGLIILLSLENEDVTEGDHVLATLRNGDSEESISGEAAVGAIDDQRVIAVVLDHDSSLAATHPLPDELYGDEVTQEVVSTTLMSYIRNPSSLAGAGSTPRNRNPLCSIWRRFCRHPR